MLSAERSRRGTVASRAFQVVAKTQGHRKGHRADPKDVAHKLKTDPRSVLHKMGTDAQRPVSESARLFNERIFDRVHDTPHAREITDAYLHWASGPDADSLEAGQAYFDAVARAITDAGVRVFPAPADQTPRAPLLKGHVAEEYITLNVAEEPDEMSRMLIEFVDGFMAANVSGRVNEIEHGHDDDFRAMREIMKKAGEDGFLAAEFPAEFGGMGYGLKTSAHVMERMSIGCPDSFLVTIMGHMGIGSVPIILFGNEEQKQRYLPKLASGEWIGAFALTEANAGSDTSGMKSTARLSEDGTKWILNGSKIFITNTAFADVFTVYAKVDGKITAFIVEKNTPGFSVGKEEEKIGLHGSSTAVINFDNMEIPVENLLGKVGEGQKVALGILNLGRWKLASSSVGGSIQIIAEVAKYVNQRRQFGKEIGNFGAMRARVADQTIQTFVAQSITHRIAGEFDEKVETADGADLSKKSGAWRDLAVQAAIAKVVGSETYTELSKSGVQALGGYGYTEEYPLARRYRDSVVTTIFEGTNDINRVYVIGRSMLTNDSMPSQVPSPESLIARLETVDMLFDGHPLEHAIRQAELAKELAVYAHSLILSDPELRETALRDPKKSPNEGQMILTALANLTIGAYGIDSAVQRALKLTETYGAEAAAVPNAIAQVHANDELRRMLGIIQNLLAQIYDGRPEDYETALRRISDMEYIAPVNLAKLKDVIAGRVLEREGYDLMDVRP